MSIRRLSHPAARQTPFIFTAFVWYVVAGHAAEPARDLVVVSGPSTDMQFVIAVLTPLSRLVQSPYSESPYAESLSSELPSLTVPLGLSAKSQTVAAVMETLTTERAAVAVAPQSIDAIEQEAQAQNVEVQPPATAADRLMALETAHIIPALSNSPATFAVTAR